VALRNADRVKETSTTTGTGTYSLAGAAGADLAIVGARYADALAASEAWVARTAALPVPSRPC